MPWTPKYSACFEEPLVNNVLAIIERDMQAALDYFYPTENLNDFAERTLGQLQGNSYPALEISPISNPVDEADASDRLQSAGSFEIRLIVTDSGPQAVTRKIMRYVRCLDAVLRSANKSDYFANITGQRFGLVIALEHGYERRIRTNGSIYARFAVLLLTIKINER